MRGRALSLLPALLACGDGLSAQGFALGETVTPAPEDFPLALPGSPVLTLDQEELFARSAFGRRVARELQEASAALAAENRRIEEELTAEERALTEERATLSAEAFRARADAFDEKVVALRQRQDAKARALQRREEAERQAFLAAVLPVLADLVADLGAVAILDDRAVLFAAGSVDVTDRAIARVDAAIGAGEDLSPGEREAPEATGAGAETGADAPDGVPPSDP